MGSDTAAMLEFCGKSRSLDLENDGEEIGPFDVKGRETGREGLR